MPVRTERQEYFFPVAMFRGLTGMTTKEFENLNSTYPETRPNAEGMPIFATIKALNSERRILASSMGVEQSAIGGNMDVLGVESQLQEERVLKEKILNQTKLGILISKKQAENRIKTVLKTVMSMLKNAIREVSIKLGEPRIVEAILTDAWNTIFAEVEKHAKILSWDDDGETNLSRTRQLILQDDPEFMKYLSSGSTEVSKEEIDEVPEEPDSQS